MHLYAPLHAFGKAGFRLDITMLDKTGFKQPLHHGIGVQQPILCITTSHKATAHHVLGMVCMQLRCRGHQRLCDPRHCGTLFPNHRKPGFIKTCHRCCGTNHGGNGFPAPEVRAIRQGVLDSCFARPATDGLTANDIIAITRKHLPAEGVLFAETGVFVCMLEHLWSAPLPRTFFGSSGGRSMGLTVPALLGAKLAAPEKQMVGFGGDGSLLMRLGELESFGRCADQLKGTPLIIINDQALGTMQARQRSRKMEPYSLKFHPVEYGAIATACGMGSATVTNAAEFEAALVEAMKPDSPPTLIDARVDARAYQDSFAATIGNLE